MERIFTQKYYCSAAEGNAEQELALPLLAEKIIDIATLHANSLGIGNPAMEHLNAGWILSRLTIEMDRYPAVNENYSISTWVEGWNRHFSTRDFRICDAEGNTIGYARSIWMIIRTTDRGNVGLDHLSLPEDFIVGNPVPISTQAKHVKILPPGTQLPDHSRDLVATEPPFHYRFQYSDIDFYRHVNTIRYIVLLLNRFTLEDFDRTYPRRFELSFLHEAIYGQSVDILRHDLSADPRSSSFSIADSLSGQPLLFARFLRSPRP
ncbi:MAG: hypothetical protein J6C81_02480 [Muribaculaceae bacterium]|nr:hypothetical protein [Muribaculaceae bacterium]